MKKRGVFLLCFGFIGVSFAQTNEIGLFIGGSNYTGDIGSTTYIRPNAPAIGIIYRFNKNPRITYRTTLTNMTISANDSDSKNKISQSFQNSFKKRITELTAGFEFNFFEYLTRRGQKHTPYFIFEIAAFQYKAAKDISPLNNINYKTKRSIAIPFGIGYKYQFIRKFALSIETRVRYTFTDDIDDGLFIKQNILSPTTPNYEKFNNTSTKDWYVFTGLSITYTFGRPPCYSTSKN